MKIIHLMPGVGKTWLAKRYPDVFIDTDQAFEDAGLSWKGRVHLLARDEKMSAIMAASVRTSAKIALTNDHGIAEVSLLHRTLPAYLSAVRRRSNINLAQAELWYAACREGRNVHLADDPQRVVIDQYATNSQLEPL